MKEIDDAAELVEQEVPSDEPIRGILTAMLEVLRRMDEAQAAKQIGLADRVANKVLSTLDRHIDARLADSRRQWLNRVELLGIAAVSGFVVGAFVVGVLSRLI